MAPEQKHWSQYSRRRFLGLSLSAGASAVVGSAGLLGFASGDVDRMLADSATMAVARSDRFGRMFTLPPFAQPTARVAAALLEIARPGGMLDAGDDLAAGAMALIVDPALSANNPNSATHTAGATFVGQFMDHDITFDLTSRLGRPTSAEGSPNGRTPAFDLDSVYGGGPAARPELYDSTDPVKLKVESGGRFEDLPRVGEGAIKNALVGDPRNDENLVIAGLQAAFLLFHNRTVDYLRDASFTDDIFNEARRIVMWHYQWMIVHEFLPLFVGQTMVDDILANGRRYYRPKQGPFIPVEFQGAAYRFGHSMVRPSYRVNFTGNDGDPFFAVAFDPSQFDQNDPEDMVGGHRAPRRFIDWQTFFDFGDGEVKPNKKIDTRISSPLFDLPTFTIAGPPGGPTALAQRTLLRHLTWLLPSGQSIARAMGVTPLSEDDLGELAGFGFDFETSTPLWYYVLKEAELTASGEHLGEVGGRIVGEVILGLLELDAESYLAADPLWTPELPQRSGRVTGEFRMVDFLTWARVDPDSRTAAP